MWYIKLHLIDAAPYMLAKPADMLQLEFRIIKKKVSLTENISLNVVVQLIAFNIRF